MAYQAQLKALTKMGTQHIIDKLINNDKFCSIEKEFYKLVFYMIYAAAMIIIILLCTYYIERDGN